MAYSKKKIKSAIGIFLKQYKRKSNKCCDPNDRGYDRKLERIVKKMDPTELSGLMSGED